MRDVLIGQVDYSVLVKIIGTDGAPEAGLAHTDIDIAYSRVETDNDVTTTDVAPADLANLTAAHSDWGWEEVSATDHPGLYRLDIADAVFATGAWEAVVTITDASGTDFYPVDIGFRLVAFNVQDGVRFGLTALPNAAADAAGGLPISDAGGLDLDAVGSAVTSGTHGNAALKTLIDNVDNIIDTEIADLGNRLPAALVSGRMDASLGAVQSGVDFSATMKASINTEADTALSDIHLDHLLAVADPIGVVADNSFWAKLHSKNVTAAYSSYDKSTDSLEALATSMASGFFDAQATAGTAQLDLDILTGADGVILATSQPNYAPATAAALASVAADLPARITKNTALSAFPFFMVDSTDHVTAETGLTITATRSIDGGAFGACANSATEIGSGWYKIDLAAADLNGNTIVLSFAGTGADTRFVAIVTQNT